MIVVHVGGVYGDAIAGNAALCHALLALPEMVRRRLALEHDDRRYSFDDALLDPPAARASPSCWMRCTALSQPGRAHAGRGVAGRSGDVVRGSPPEDSFSPARALHCVVRRPLGERAPLPNQHSDFIDPFAFIDLLEVAQRLRARPFDVMLEAKARTWHCYGCANRSLSLPRHWRLTLATLALQCEIGTRPGRSVANRADSPQQSRLHVHPMRWQPCARN